MADEEDLLGSMDDLGDEEGEEEESGEGSPLMRYLPLIGGVLVVQLIIGYAIAALIFGGSDEPSAEGEEGAPLSWPVRFRYRRRLFGRGSTRSS